MVPLTRSKTHHSSSKFRALEQHDGCEGAAQTSGNTLGFIHTYLMKKTLKPSCLWTVVIAVLRHRPALGQTSQRMLTGLGGKAVF